MIRKYLFQISLSSILFLLFGNLSAQDLSIFFAPSPECIQECTTMAISSQHPSTLVQSIWTYQGQSYTINDSQYFEPCENGGPFLDGDNIVSVVATYQDGTVLNASLSFFYSYDLPSLWSSTAPEVCSSNEDIIITESDSASSNVYHYVNQQVCVGTSVKYCLDNVTWLPSNNTTSNWFFSYAIENATSYTIDPDNSSCIIVEWGNIGQGSYLTTDYCNTYIHTIVDILPEPIAAISATIPITNDTLIICQGQTIDFLNHSEFADTYYWNFEFTTSQEEQPSITFDTPGTYTVNMLASNACSCNNQDQMIVIVEQGDSPALDCISTVCYGEEITYTADLDCGNYIWDVSSNGSITQGGESGDDFITVLWESGYEGLLSLTVGGCSADECLAPTVVNIPIISPNVPIQGESLVCNGTRVSYSIPSYDGTSFEWETTEGGTIISGQGSNEILVEWHTYQALPKNEMVSVTYENCFLECGGEASLPIKILPQYHATGPIEVCQNTSEIYETISTYSNMSIPATWTILQGDDEIWSSDTPLISPAIMWDIPAGTYELQVTPASANSYCTEGVSIFVTVAEITGESSTLIGPQTICLGESYVYEVISDNSQNTFDWQVIYNGIDTLFTTGNPIIVEWEGQGPFSLQVIESSNGGLSCPGEPLYLNATANSDISIQGDTDICAEQISTFSTQALEGIDYNWLLSPPNVGTIIGDTNSDTIQIIWHQEGTYNLSLTSCNQATNINVSIHEVPQPTVVAPTALCPNEFAQISVTQNYASYSWRDSSGVEISTSPTPSLAAGAYQLIVENELGCTNNTTFTIQTYAITPIIVSSPAFPYQPLPLEVPIFALETNDGYSYEWFLNGNSIGFNDQTSITATTFGNYHVQTTSPDGCIQQSNIINFGLGVSYPVIGGMECDGYGISFTTTQQDNCNSFDFSATANIDLNSLIWDLGDDTPLSMPGGEVSHTYDNAGYYNVNIISELDDNLLCGYQQIVRAAASANFTNTTACFNQATVFTDISSFLPNTTITDWFWDFGDPASGTANTSTLTNPTHIFSTQADYDVTLTVTSSDGCTSSITKTVSTLPRPNSSFEVSSVLCAATTSSFEATEQGESTALSWNFGNPSSGHLNNSQVSPAFHEYTVPGDYTVSLEVQNIHGCTDTSYLDISIPNAIPPGDITPAVSSTICEGDSVLLTAPSGGTHWLWSTGDTTASIYATEAGTYNTTIISSAGCDYTTPIVILNVIPSPDITARVVEYDEYGNPTAYYYTTYEVCYGDDVTLEVVGNTQNGISWSTNETTTIISFTEDKGNLLPIGTTDVNVSSTDAITGCTTVSTVSIIVHGIPDDFTIVAPDTSLICEGTSTSFLVETPNTDYVYTWNTGEIGTQLTTSEAGQYLATATNLFGCTNTSNTLDITQGPDIAKIPSGCHEVCASDTICIPELEDIITYQWFFNGEPIAAPTGTAMQLPIDSAGVYYVEMENEVGCFLTSDPLTLETIEVLGTVLGGVYADVDNDGIISPLDTLIPNVTIDYNTNTFTTDDQGLYTLEDIPADDYTFIIDESSLPSNSIAIWTQIDSSILDCDQELTIDWLIQTDCADSTTIELFFCQGDSVQHNQIFYSESGTFTQTHLNADNCDSIETIIVQELVTPTEELELFVCDFDVIYFEGDTLIGGDEATYTYSAANGCDSIVHVSVTQHLKIITLLSFPTCFGEPLEYQGLIIQPNTAGILTFTAANGCDSLVIIDAIEQPQISSSIEVPTCFGQALEYEGTTILPGEEGKVIYTATNGCDSTVFVTAVEQPLITATLEISTCVEQPIIWDGQSIPVGTSADFTYTSSMGCDSILTVTANAAPPIIDSTYLNICYGEQVQFQGQTLGGGEQATFVLTASNGCDSTLTVFVSAASPLESDIITSPICSDSNDGSIEIDAFGGYGNYTYTLNNNTISDDNIFDNLPPGTYQITIEDNEGCLHSSNVTIPAFSPLIYEAHASDFSCQDLEAELSVTLLSGDEEDLTITWSNGQIGSNIIVTDIGQFHVNVSNQCETQSSSVEVLRHTSINDKRAFIPSAFSPNNDGINDTFKPLFSDNITVQDIHFVVYNRWGGKVFETTQIGEGWNGKRILETHNVGVFVWTLEATINVCGEIIEIEQAGDVTLINW